MKKLLFICIFFGNIHSIYAFSLGTNFLLKSQIILNKILNKSYSFVQTHKASTALIASGLVLISITKPQYFFKYYVYNVAKKFLHKQHTALQPGWRTLQVTQHPSPGPLTGKLVKIIGTPEFDVLGAAYHKLVGKIAEIRGTSEEIWGIPDIMEDHRSFTIPPIANYLAAGSPSKGLVYYGKVDSIGYCFHESWLQEFNTFKINNFKRSFELTLSHQLCLP